MITTIAQHLPFILLVTLSVCALLYVTFRLDEIPEQKKTKYWLNRHPRLSAVVAGVIFVIVSLIVISLATDIL